MTEPRKTQPPSALPPTPLRPPPIASGRERSVIPNLQTPVALVQLPGETPFVPGAAGAEGHHIFGQEIGRGGMGLVHLVKDVALGRRVAMKMLLPEEADNVQLRQALAKEAQITGQLEHPNIIPIYELSARRDGHLYYTMRLMEGTSLSEVILKLRAGDRLVQREYTLLRRLQIFQQICMGLHYAHSRGVLHCDVKPGNILLGKFGEVYILDWGVAQMVGLEGRLRTGTGIVPEDRIEENCILGTPYYMSPEQASGQIPELDARTDIYSLGVILFQLLALDLPFEAPDTDRYMKRVRNEEIPAPHTRCVGPAIPAELESIIQKACAHDRCERYGDAQALWQDIEQYLEGRREKERRERLAREAVEQGQKAEAYYRSLTARRLALEETIEHERRRHATAWLTTAERQAQWRTQFEMQNIEILLAKSFSQAVTEYSRALGYSPDQRLARRQLAQLYWERFQQAEKLQNIVDMTYFGELAQQLEESLAERTPDEGEALPLGEVSIRTFPEGATVAVLGPRELAEDPARAEGRPLGQAPLTDVRLPVGIRLLIARKSGFRDAQKVVFVREDTKQYVLITLQPWSSQVPMVGRESELAQVTGLFQSTIDHQSRASLLVTGEPGIGKTRLQEAFQVYLDERPDSVIFIWVQADPSFQGVPFAAIAKAIAFRAGLRSGDGPEPIKAKLRELVQTAFSHEGAWPLNEDEQHLAEETAQILATLPAIGLALEPPPAPQAADGTRERMFQALLAYFIRLSEWLPVAILFKEIQWIDGSSRILLERLLRVEQAGPIFVLGTATSSGDEDRLAALRGFGRQNRLHLGPLEANAVNQHLSELLKGRADFDIAASVCDKARGNPYLSEELAHYLVEHECIENHDGQWQAGRSRTLDLPDVEVHHFSAQRFQRLPKAERDALRRAAVIGRIFWDDAVRALGQSAPRAVLENLVGLDMIQATSSSRYPLTTEFRFRLEVLWRVAYSSLSSEERRAYHLVAARWLQEQGVRLLSQEAAIAYHFDQAGEAKRAAAVYQRMAMRCEELQAFEEAVYHYDRALSQVMGERHRKALREARQKALSARGIYLKNGSLSLQSGHGYPIGQPLGDTPSSAVEPEK